ncbi:hypothetical protein ABT214_10095 [Micromonospora purpureochromogenes]|uniref:hypothetical protein n=1 Tax=Micromonospora purpureochromogenes TaxID=47872 RepID=UPI003331C444
MARPPGSTVVAVALVAGSAALVSFLLGQGLDRANLWAGVLALLLTIAGALARAWSGWVSPRPPDGGRRLPTVTGVPAGGPDRPARDPDGPAGDRHRSDGGPSRDTAGRVAGLFGAGSGSYRTVAAVVVATVLAVLVVVNLPTGAGPPEVRPTGTGPVAPPGWVKVGGGERLTLADGQSFDLARGVAGGELAPGADLLLTQRADRLGVREPGELAVVGPGADHEVRRCLEADSWDGTIDGVHELAAGTDVCVRTADGRCAMLTVESPPDVVTRVLTFRYTLWERR